jgi:hypothetical protein
MFETHEAPIMQAGPPPQLHTGLIPLESQYSPWPQQVSPQSGPLAQVPFGEQGEEPSAEVERSGRLPFAMSPLPPSPPLPAQRPAWHERAPAQVLPAQQGSPALPQCWQLLVARPVHTSDAPHMLLAQQPWPSPPHDEEPEPQPEAARISAAASVRNTAGS